ncbi:MAG: hypothetical protein ACRDI2_14695 [Chloroflexota bacterium]
MAQVAHTDVAADVDDLLAYLTRHWRAIPDIARDWPTWDPVDQDVFDLEWTIKEERLAHLQQHAARGQLTAAQHAQYDALLKLVAANRPLLQQLLKR